LIPWVSDGVSIAPRACIGNAERL